MSTPKPIDDLAEEVLLIGRPIDRLLTRVIRVRKDKATPAALRPSFFRLAAALRSAQVAHSALVAVVDTTEEDIPA